MPRPTRDLTGQVFGRLTVLSRAVAAANGRTRWHCRCECGNVITLNAEHLISGNNRSCGCLRVDTTRARSITHGQAGVGRKTLTYRIWVGMHQRCRNPKNPKYEIYGGRGIRVCSRWFAFENFVADMGEAPAGLSIERKDTNGNYEPGNCEWATQEVQQNNRRNNRRVVINGTCIFNLSEIEELVGVSRQTIIRRIAANKPIIYGKKVFRITEYVPNG